MSIKNPSREELFAAANMISENCRGILSDGVCEYCDFYNKNGCRLSEQPYNWPTFNDFDFNEPDVLMAKALMSYGFTHVKRNRDGKGEVYAVKMEYGEIVLIEQLPNSAFVNIGPSLYSLADLIPEAESEKQND